MILSEAPLRLSFFGGGSDFPEVFAHQPAAVLSTAIEWTSRVSVHRPPRGVAESPLRAVHERIENCQRVADLAHPLIRSALEHARLEPPLELHAWGDLPSGLGLGSSSSFAVALLDALDALEGRERSPLELAYEAIALERRVGADAVGCQDQAICALGGLRRLEFRALDDIRSHELPISPARRSELEAHLLLVRVGARRAAPRLERRKLERVERNRRALAGMVAQVDRACDLLCGGGPLAELGTMLDAAWQAKRHLAEGVSTPEIDALYHRGREAGALGGKMLGAGGGGFLLLFAPPER
ncbi:MAG: GHMP kinase, partial [Acidobacteriota bacterium]